MQPTLFCRLPRSLCRYYCCSRALDSNLLPKMEANEKKKHSKQHQRVKMESEKLIMRDYILCYDSVIVVKPAHERCTSHRKGQTEKRETTIHSTIDDIVDSAALADGSCGNVREHSERSPSDNMRKMSKYEFDNFLLLFFSTLKYRKFVA